MSALYGGAAKIMVATFLQTTISWIPIPICLLGLSWLFILQRIFARHPPKYLTAFVLSLSGFIAFWAALFAIGLWAFGFPLNASAGPRLLAVLVGAVAASYNCATSFSNWLAKRPDTTPNSSADKHTIPRDGLLKVKYDRLLDEDELVRTGDKLGTALKDVTAHGNVQPFLAGYSELLPIAIEMLGLHKGHAPFSSIMDLFPVGTSEPAWVALFRSGRIHCTTDGRSHVRLYLIGTNPHDAYHNNYSTIRHCLIVLQRLSASRFGIQEITIDVFAYRNEYQSRELILNCIPYTVTQSAFRTDKEVLLNLKALTKFFATGAAIELVRLYPGSYLHLRGRTGTKQTVDGKPLELSDLAVAYRAMFHAGANRPFVSLDPHRDATKAKVNFGGFLENTRLGAVLLKADVRFKTITTGIDPYTSFQDVRSEVRKFPQVFLLAPSAIFSRRTKRLRNVQWVPREKGAN